VLRFEVMVSRNFAAAILSGCAALLFISFTTFGFASTSGSAPPLTPKERETTAQKFVSQRLRIWQERLDLQDWNIRVDLVRPSELEPKTLGNVHWDTDAKRATIGVLSSYDYTLPWQEMLDDMEFTIVHELVHLHLASLPRSEASRRIEEQAVNELAGALLKLAKH
jgi:hypothetical protein